MTSKALALVLAGAAVALAGAALIIVATRPHVPPIPTLPEPFVVVAKDVAALEHDPATRYTIQGAHVDNAELASRLHLEPRDVIVALSGRAILDRRDVDAVVVLGGTEVIVELVRDGQTMFERWKIDGDLRGTRYSFSAPAGSASPSPTPTPMPTPAPPQPDPLLDTIVRDDDTHMHLPRATVEALLADPAKASKGARIVPAVRNGAPDGFKLYSIRPGSVEARLGLQNGDTIHAINGLQLTTADSALVVYPQLRHASHLDVSIERRGVPMMISIQIN